MPLFLSSFLQQLVYPVGLSISLALVAYFFSLLRWRRIAKLLAILAVGITWISSTPIFAERLYAQLESQYPPVHIADTPNADVVIILGGSLAQPAPPRTSVELVGSSDRILHAARLYRAGKVSRIIAAGGNRPWTETARPEALDVAMLLQEWGVPESAITLETESRTTYENAIYVKRVMENSRYRNALLVTSAVHMPRALATFRAAGMNVIPASTDIAVVHKEHHTVLDWLPDAGALLMTTLAMKEWLGMVVYRWRGWVE